MTLDLSFLEILDELDIYGFSDVVGVEFLLQWISREWREREIGASTHRLLWRLAEERSKCLLHHRIWGGEWEWEQEK